MHSMMDPRQFRLVEENEERICLSQMRSSAIVDYGIFVVLLKLDISPINMLKA